MTTPRNSAARSQSVWVKEKGSGSTPQASKSQSKVSLNHLKKRVSQVTDQLSGGGDSSQRNSCELIELNEQACSCSVASLLVFISPYFDLFSCCALLFCSRSVASLCFVFFVVIFKSLVLKRGRREGWGEGF